MPEKYATALNLTILLSCLLTILVVLAVRLLPKEALRAIFLETFQDVRDKFDGKMLSAFLLVILLIALYVRGMVTPKTVWTNGTITDGYPPESALNTLALLIAGFFGLGTVELIRKIGGKKPDITIENAETVNNKPKSGETDLE